MRPRSALCMIVGFLREADASCALLGYYAASSGNYLPMFRDETSVSNYQYSLRNNPEERTSKGRQIFPTVMFGY